MSSGKIRTEKECLNCGHIVEHLFCSKCGQKNVEIKENFWHLALHYIKDYFHFDSKLLHSFKPLILKPGFLPKEYMEGRRAKYINPIGSLIFLSTIFFIIFLSISNGNKGLVINSQEPKVVDSIQTQFKADSNLSRLKDSVKVNLGNKTLNNKISAKVKELLSEGHESEREVFLDKFKHNFPKVMVLLIPFLSFFLWFIFIRKHLLYVEHLIFVIYTHCFVYLLLTVSFLLSLLWHPIFPLSFMLIILYIIMAMKYFYQQSFLKTIFKFFFVSLCYSLLLVFGLVLNGLISVL